jgi:hypothetical protein
VEILIPYVIAVFVLWVLLYSHPTAWVARAQGRLNNALVRSYDWDELLTGRHRERLRQLQSRCSKEGEELDKMVKKAPIGFSMGDSLVKDYDKLTGWIESFAQEHGLSKRNKQAEVKCFCG